MHDVLDIIRNVQSLYAISPSLGILKDFERVIAELDITFLKIGKMENYWKVLLIQDIL